MPETTPFEICDLLTGGTPIFAIAATEAGIPGRDHLWDDFSPEAAKQELRAKAVAELASHLDHPDPVQAAAGVARYLESERHLYDSGHWKRNINHIYGPFQTARRSTSCRRKGQRRGERDDPPRPGATCSTDTGPACKLAGRRGIVARRQVSVIEQVRSVAGPDSRWLAPGRGCRWRRRGSGG